ncbi:MAG: 1-acyl-sn-glycerol-3-phosphate acyltransferase [Pseudomonadota bacterium]|nr:1-acyl-sn-glycerol-3-phosphate acyltransferase [Pseudomonadota bacterium]
MLARAILRCIGLVNLVVFGVFTLLTFLVAMPLQALASPWDPDRRVSARAASAVWGVGMFRAQPFWRLTITGAETMGPGPWIVIANHQSMLDIPLLLQLPVPVRVVARPGVFRMPVFGQMARFGKHVRLDADNVEEGLAQCRHLLTQGISIVLFPEGQRGDGTVLGSFHRGAFELALRTGAPLLPVAISGTALALPKGSAWARVPIARFHLQILPPLPLDGRSRRRLAADAHTILATALAGPRPWSLTHAVAERYRPAGRFRMGFAAGKVRFDPIFWHLWERLPRTGRLLDVGAGEGLLGIFLREAGSQLVVRGVDIDEARIAAAKVAAGSDPALTFEVLDGEDAPFSQADVVTCIDVLHYLTPDRQDRLLARLCAAVAPGGTLYVRDPEVGQGLASWWTATSERIFVALGRHRGGGVHVRGGAVLAEVVGRHLSDVRLVRAGTGPFANVLLEARRPVAEVAHAAVLADGAPANG